MQTDSSMLVWTMRLQQTEALIQKRKEDLLGHQQRCRQLEAELKQEESQSEKAVRALATLREHCEGLTGIRVQLQMDISAARQDIAAANDTVRLEYEKRALQQQLWCLKAASESERSLQQQYEASIHSYMEQQRHRTQELKDRAEQIRTRLERLNQQEAKLCLPTITSNLQQQQDQLQSKPQQLTTTLTDSKQANACMTARVEAAAAATKNHLQTATERVAEVKRLMFQLKRQAAVNEARLQQLRQESSRSKHQCWEVEELIGRASAVMDQLASNVDV